MENRASRPLSRTLRHILNAVNSQRVPDEVVDQEESKVCNKTIHCVFTATDLTTFDMSAAMFGTLVRRLAMD